MKSLVVIAGEISGDTHGAELIRSLPALEAWRLSGLGGPRIASLSGEVEDWLDEAAVLGLLEVLKKYGYFKEKLQEAIRHIEKIQPDGVLLIDYPGFNLRLAKQLRDRGYQGKLIYYISPQVWAWKKGRVKTMAALLDLMICIFPFEKSLYEESGLLTEFAGHPLIDEMAEVRDESIARDPGLVAMLPGSREREIAKLFPPMLEAAAILQKEKPELRFATTGATAPLTQRLREMVDEAGLTSSFSVGEATSHHIMQQAGVGVVASGTATLEAACLELPYCLTYKVAAITAAVARRVMSVDYLGIVNVMADREVVKELLQQEANGPSIASEISRLLNDETARWQIEKDIAEVVAMLGGGGAHENAARSVAAALGVES